MCVLIVLLFCAFYFGLSSTQTGRHRYSLTEGHGALKRAFLFGRSSISCLAAKAVQGASLALQGVDDVHGGDGLPLGVLGVGDGVANDVLEKHLEDAASLLVDQARDTLDAASTGQTTDGRLGDALDVVTKDLAMTLGATLAESLASFASSRHVFSK